MNRLVIILISTCWSAVKTSVVCQPSAAYSPCGCSEIDFTGVTALNCGRQNVSDSRASEILDAFINNNAISPVQYIGLWANQLTRIPLQIRQFPKRLVTVDLSENGITSIDSDAIHSTSPPQSLILRNNQVSAIAPGTFNGTYNK